MKKYLAIAVVLMYTASAFANPSIGDKPKPVASHNAQDKGKDKGKDNGKGKTTKGGTKGSGKEVKSGDAKPKKN